VHFWELSVTSPVDLQVPHDLTLEGMPRPASHPDVLRRPTDQVVHDTLLAWFTTPRLQDELLGRDRDAVKNVLDLLRRRLRQESRAAEQRTRADSKGRRGTV
jgi:hypothetical protein